MYKHLTLEFVDQSFSASILSRLSGKPVSVEVTTCVCLPRLPEQKKTTFFGENKNADICYYQKYTYFNMDKFYYFQMSRKRVL